MRKETSLQPPRVIISGGGTGGHIFPAIAIANALKEKCGGLVEILFVGAEGRMEMEKVPAAGYKIEALWISGLQRKLTVKNLSFPFKVISSLIKANKIMKSFNPDAVVGTGGYASGPMLRVASKAGVPTLIQEQNSYPGITNKILAGKVDRICVAYEGMQQYFPASKIILTGNPVRQDILKLDGKKARAMEFFNLQPDKKTVLVIGGSLGARTINESIISSLEEFVKNDIQLIWQTGKGFIAQANEAAKPFEKNGIVASEFISKMDYAYAAADVVISRAGASSVSELCLVKKACILVPSPNVAEDHQTKNAMALVNHQAALLVKDTNAKKELVEKTIGLLSDNSLKLKLESNISKMAFADSAMVIANEILNLIHNKKQ
ncbi:MAG TPA: undecaprenyldiphospho-muramoylpentapeptide beta-N-acetylglucosaminyltransferase [Bacteroidia bacterium]|jgi:UDP-N-acetylglucosamine--N-acetylmuramyl-(pentapeptide) pyrophosphoryl-undecaprenol N-acetylglucosamine transferase|nr:undecaprenyldiphospho-muramoylpentapeptide beta-N-acetylglucosaminyltransferase [Bacteroidia bacterium]